MNRNQILSLIVLAAIVVAILFGLAWCGQIKETNKVLAEKDAITEQALVAKNAANISGIGSSGTTTPSAGVGLAGMVVSRFQRTNGGVDAVQLVQLGIGHLARE